MTLIPPNENKVCVVPCGSCFVESGQCSCHNRASKSLAIKDIFRGMKREDQLVHKARYEELLAEELDPNRSGSVKMPWMIPLWEKGLALISEVIEEKQ